jgi:hypothetical protein
VFSNTPATFVVRGIYLSDYYEEKCVSCFWD